MYTDSVRYTVLIRCLYVNTHHTVNILEELWSFVQDPMLQCHIPVCYYILHSYTD